MEKADVDDAAVAKAAGLDRSTISRLRRGTTIAPSMVTLIRLDRWNERVREEKRWPLRYRLDWSHLLPSTDRRAPAARKVG